MSVIENKLDDALHFVCGSFDPIKYESILAAYRLLNNVHVTGKISRYYTSTIDDLMHKIVMSYPLNNPRLQLKTENLFKLSTLVH